MSKLPEKPKPTDPAWVKKEKWRKRREAQERMRISSDHELSGERHRQPHRDKDIPLSWTRGEDGKLHVTPVRITTGGGLNISDEDWWHIWAEKDKDGNPISTSKESLLKGSPREDPSSCEEH